MKTSLRYLAVVCLLLGLTSFACVSRFSNMLEEPELTLLEETDILFQDDFSKNTSGWDQFRDEFGMTDYDMGGYRIQVLQDLNDYWSNVGLNFRDAQIEVTATKLGGPDENDFGIICRYQDENNFYFFIAGNDGYYGVGKVKDGLQELLGTDALELSDVIEVGDEAVNRLVARCVGEKLTFSINGTQLIETEDDEFYEGDVGLLAGAFDEPGTDILFDDFVVRRP